MADFQHSTTIDRDPETVFAYISDVDHLRDFVRGISEAHRTGPEDVHVVANVEGTRYEGEAWMHADADAKHVRWGAEGTSAYHGELFVVSIGDEASKVTVEMHIEHGDEGSVQEGLERTLADLGTALGGA